MFERITFIKDDIHDDAGEAYVFLHKMAGDEQQLCPGSYIDGCKVLLWNLDDVSFFLSNLL